MKKICQNPNCSKEFETTSRQIKYCCDKCAKFMHKYGKETIKYKDKCCEICGKEHDHTYGSGRFCSKECKIKFIANKARNAHNPKVKAHLDKLRKEGKIVSRKPYGTWTCRICGEILETRKTLSEHIYQKHFNIASITNSIHKESGKFKCPYCEKEYENYRQVIGHMTNCPKHPLKKMHDEAHKASGRTYSKHYAEGKISFIQQSHKHTKETKEKISAIRTELISKGIGLGGRKAKTYKLPNIKGDMFFHQGTWELNVAK